ncbi:hypothetical protein QBC38DRAFT_461490 [Podospora fimiseda]|uniref:Uncharacterized protein n=1 Tax=Podospora fimiseda TaxID=252190 RepID=A0AAN6YLQ5_9PEZI|nr:hypothetical protein QBC38DRAFT_461490 [Podospora fimiseda]
MPYPPTPVNIGANFTATLHSDSYPFINPAGRTHVGKAVFVTGGTKGIGRATVLSFVQAEASRIAVAARDFEAVQKVCAEALSTVESAGLPVPEMLPLKLDVCSNESVAAAADAVKTKWGQLDILINNAGYLDSFSKVLEGDAAGWWRTWEVNVKGVYAVTRALLPLLFETKNGDKTIINLSSMLAMALYPGSSAYQASKLAVMSFTEALMVDYFDEGLLAYSIHPGAVDTDLANNMPSDAVKQFCVDTPRLAADTMVWLTREKRDWLAGRYISANWDMSEVEAQKDRIVERDLLKMKFAS